MLSKDYLLSVFHRQPQSAVHTKKSKTNESAIVANVQRQ